MEGTKNLDPEERDYYLAEMLADPFEPYALHNQRLAEALYECVKGEYETASLHVLQLEHGHAEWICLTLEAVDKLEKRLKKLKAARQKELEMIMAVLESIGGAE